MIQSPSKPHPKSDLEDQEYLISQLGQEDEVKGANLVKEYGQIKQKEGLDHLNNQLGTLELARKDYKKYFRMLLVYLEKFIVAEDIPRNFKVEIDMDDVGISVGLAGTDYSSAFRVSGMVKYDLNACKMMAVRLGNTVTSIMGNFKTTPGGIILANENESRGYLKWNKSLKNLKSNK